MENEMQNNTDFNFVYDFYTKLKDNNISFAYEGEISHEITKAFSSLAESHIAIDNEPGIMQKKVFHIMVESLQNISKHSGEKIDINSATDGQGIFFISKSETEYTITTGNVIDKYEVPGLKLVIKKINGSNKNSLKELYKEQIKKGRLSDKGGAGLGFIDIVRKTGQQLIYSFLDINEKKTYFVLTSTVSRIK
ncbi:MAG: SiaB family protein kinase [Bacteroidales bacterium]|nr:SiaB family protein kinase [Bacteroidales bacterium]